MTNEIHTNQPETIFDEESRDKLGWLTKIEVMNGETGAQILSENLPLGGFTFEDKDDQPQIEMMVKKNQRTSSDTLF